MGDSGRRGAALSIAAAAVLWSTGGLFIKLAPMPGLAVAGGRSLVAFLFYLLVLRPNLRAARWATALSYAGCILTFVAATKLTTAANAIFLQYTGPAYVLVLSPFLLGERFRPLDAACVALSLAGMGLLFVGKVEPGQGAGNALAIASGVFFALTVVLMRRDARGAGGDALPSTALGNLCAAAIALPLAGTQLAAALTPRGGGVLLYLGVVQLGVAYLLFVRGLRRVPAAEASLLTMLEPVLNPVWVLLGFGERPSPWALAGGGVVIASVLLRTIAGARTAPEAGVTGAPLTD